MMTAQILCLISIFIALKNKPKRCRVSSKIPKYRKRVTLEDGSDVVDEEFQPFSPLEGPSDSHSHGTIFFRSKKRSKRVVEDDISMVHIAKSIERMVGLVHSLSKSTAELINQNKDVDAENMIWSQLEEIGVEPALLPSVYMHLVQNPVDMKAFDGIPIHKRKEMLPHIGPGYPPSI